MTSPVLHRTRTWRGCIGWSDYTVDLDVEWTVQHRDGVWTAMPTLVRVGNDWPVDERCVVTTSRKAMIAALTEIVPPSLAEECRRPVMTQTGGTREGGT